MQESRETIGFKWSNGTLVRDTSERPDLSAWISGMEDGERKACFAAAKDDLAFAFKDPLDTKKYNETQTCYVVLSLAEFYQRQVKKDAKHNKFTIKVERGEVGTITRVKGTMNESYQHGAPQASGTLDRASIAAHMAAMFVRVDTRKGGVRPTTCTSTSDLVVNFAPVDAWLQICKACKRQSDIIPTLVNAFSKLSDDILALINDHLVRQAPPFLLHHPPLIESLAEFAVIQKACSPVSTKVTGEPSVIVNSLHNLATARGSPKYGQGLFSEYHIMGVRFDATVLGLVEKVTDYYPVDAQVTFVDTTNKTLALAIYRVIKECFPEREHVVVVYKGRNVVRADIDKVVGKRVTYVEVPDNDVVDPLAIAGSIDKIDGIASEAGATPEAKCVEGEESLEMPPPPKTKVVPITTNYIAGSGILAVDRIAWKSCFKGLTSNFVSYNAAPSGSGSNSEVMIDAQRKDKNFFEDHIKGKYTHYQYYTHVSALKEGDRPFASCRARKELLIKRDVQSTMTLSSAYIHIYNALRHSLLYPYLESTMMERDAMNNAVYQYVRGPQPYTYDFTPLNSDHKVIVSEDAELPTMAEKRQRYAGVFQTSTTAAAPAAAPASNPATDRYRKAAAASNAVKAPEVVAQPPAPSRGGDGTFS